jgi:hypothetical protein
LARGFSGFGSAFQLPKPLRRVSSVVRHLSFLCRSGVMRLSRPSANGLSVLASGAWSRLTRAVRPTASSSPPRCAAAQGARARSGSGNAITERLHRQAVSASAIWTLGSAAVLRQTGFKSPTRESQIGIAFTPSCIDPAVSAQVRLLKHKPQQGSSCRGPGEGVPRCKSGSNPRSHGWRAAGFRTGGGARIGL